MSIYQDLCWELAERYEDYTQYITSERMGERLFIERHKYDEDHPERFGGSRHAWDMKLYRIAVEAWNEANPGKEVTL
jgi:hypothetical protein